MHNFSHNFRRNLRKKRKRITKHYKKILRLDHVFVTVEMYP